jgi:hypothetical protein
MRDIAGEGHRATTPSKATDNRLTSPHLVDGRNLRFASLVESHDTRSQAFRPKLVRVTVEMPVQRVAARWIGTVSAHVKNLSGTRDRFTSLDK